MKFVLNVYTYYYNWLYMIGFSVLCDFLVAAYLTFNEISEP